MTNKVNIRCTACGHACIRPRKSLTRHFCDSCGKRHQPRDINVQVIVRRPTIRIEEMLGRALRNYRTVNPGVSGFSTNRGFAQNCRLHINGRTSHIKLRGLMQGTV